MKGYRKIADNYIEIQKDELNDNADLEDNLISQVNHAVTTPVLDHGEKTGILEYKVVIYAKRK